jgi:Na+/proline symporter
MLVDLLLAAVVLALVLLVGVVKRRAAAGAKERFAAGRQLSWLVLGASMAASSMSADTPLLIAGAVYMDGMAGNWFWWAGAPGVLATLFFFARLWRRSGVLTEIEIFRLRYGDGAAAHRYRMFQALLEGVVLNVLVMASNGYAFGLILAAMLKRWHLASGPGLAAILVVTCFLAAAAYALWVGFRGLVKSDAVEFLVAILAGFVLAGVAIAGMPGGLDALSTLDTARAGGAVFAAWPVEDPLAPLLLLSLAWWHLAPGRGMTVQRIVASRDERSAMLTVGTFAVFHFLLRPWGWYLIGAAALFYLPKGSGPDQAMPALAGALLPEGLFGVILAVTALAFMGCVNSRVNFGASLVVNDVALALRPDLSAKNVRRLETVTVVALTIAGAGFALVGFTSSIRAVYQFLTMMLAGTGFVSIARWYWWRTSILSEALSLLSAALIASLTLIFADISDPTDFAAAVAINFLTGVVVTVAAAFLGKPTPEPLLQAFHEKVSPGGPGWRRFGVSQGPQLPVLGLQWLLANLTLFAAILAGVRLLARELLQAGAFLAFAVLCALTLAWLFLCRAPGATARGKPTIQP